MNNNGPRRYNTNPMEKTILERIDMHRKDT